MFTIVIPTYNRDSDLEECLISIKNNTVLPYEVIVLHSGQQSTTAICEKCGAKSVFDNARKNGKRVKTLWAIINDGIKLAKYDYVMYLNDDCLVMPDWDTIASKYFKDEKTGLLILKSKGIGNIPYFRIQDTPIIGLPCANYAIINRKAGILFDENYDWYYGDSDISAQFAANSSFLIKTTAEDMVIHNHKIDINRKEHDGRQIQILNDVYRFKLKWCGYKLSGLKLKRKFIFLFIFTMGNTIFIYIIKLVKLLIKKLLLMFNQRNGY